MNRLAASLLGATVAAALFSVPDAHAHGDLLRALAALPVDPLDLSRSLAPELLRDRDPRWEEAAEQSYTLFESGQVRPLALSPDGKLLFALNTPDGRLEVFRVQQSGIEHRCSIQVGLEPVAVAARSAREVWVVNHLSDSVSVVAVDEDGRGGRVARTLLVGDEPRDIVFAGPGGQRAFITTAHRGQNSPLDPQLTTAGVGRADVWVFDAEAIGDSLGGDPETILTLFTDAPRALAVSPGGEKVYAAGFHTGNATASIFELFVPDGGELMGGIPGPRTNHEGVPAPETGILVKFDGEHWRDEIGRVWDEQMRFTLPDRDVFVIDASADPPFLEPGGAFSGVGTILFNMAINPVTGAVYVSNTDANNMERFEGPGIFAGKSLRGHLHESRVTVLKGGRVSPRHLNKHIDYASDLGPVGGPESQKSLAFPVDMQVSGDGETLYVAALGSSKVGVFATAALENDTFVPSESSHIPVSGGGPAGLALDEARGRLYVLTRFDNAIAVVDTKTRREIGKAPMYNPEPTRVVRGRPILYDAAFSSSRGDSACASCHVFGDLDSLGWDLGNPDADVEPNQNPMTTMASGVHLPTSVVPVFHPMKGPMTTQSLRGMENHGAMHWRGDRNGASEEASAQPDSGSYDEDAAFGKFAGAFPDLLGRDALISEEDMRAFTDFILELTYPPNPIRNLDNSLTPEQARGRDVYFDFVSTGGNTCEQCHRLDPKANEGFTHRPGFFGTDGNVSFDFEPQMLKVPHLRNLYQKVGRFGQPPHPIILPGGNEPMGEQIRGFGFTHDGGFDTIFRFDRLAVLQFPEGDKSRREVESFFLAYDSNMAPIVGQQVTLSEANAGAANARVDLLIQRTEAGECDLVVRAGKEGYVYAGAGTFVGDLGEAEAALDGDLRESAIFGGRPLTYTCAPPGSGWRMGVDRDLDGHLDGDERAAGSDPGDPESVPESVPMAP